MSDVNVIPFDVLLAVVQGQWSAVKQYRKLVANRFRYEHWLREAYSLFNQTMIVLIDQHFDSLTMSVDVDKDSGERIFPLMLVVEYGNYKFRVPVVELSRVDWHVVDRIREMFAEQQGISPKYGFSQKDENYVTAHSLYKDDPEVVFDDVLWKELKEYSFEELDYRKLFGRGHHDGKKDVFFEIGFGRYYLCKRDRIVPLPMFTLRGTHSNGWFMATPTIWMRYDYVAVAMNFSQGSIAQAALRWLVATPDGEMIPFSEGDVLPENIGEIALEPALSRPPTDLKRIVKALVGSTYELVALIVIDSTGKYLVPATPKMSEAWETSQIINIVPANLNLHKDLGFDDE